MTAADPTEICVYCATARLTGRERPEHVIPAALGASLTVRTVCDDCNTWAGREIDQPFLADSLLREYRSMVDQRDPRRRNPRRVPSTLLRGVTSEGDFVAFDRDTQRPVMGSRIVELGEGRYQIRAGSEEEAQRLLERMRTRAAAEGKEVRIEEEQRGESRPEIQAGISVHGDAWRREAAKIGLAIGSLVYAAGWRTSDDAHRLREWMHDRDPRTADGGAPALVPIPIGNLAPLVRHNEHLAFFMRLSDSWTYVNIVLFGTTLFAVPVNSTDAPPPRAAWRLDWLEPNKDGTTTFDELMLDAVLRWGADSDSGAATTGDLETPS